MAPRKNNIFDSDDENEIDSSDDSIENEEQLIKEEGRGFIVDEDEEEIEEDEEDEEEPISRKKASLSDDEEISDEDEEDLREEIEDLIGNNKKRRLIRDSEDDDSLSSSHKKIKPKINHQTKFKTKKEPKYTKETSDEEEEDQENGSHIESEIEAENEDEAPDENQFEDEVLEDDEAQDEQEEEIDDMDDFIVNSGKNRKRPEMIEDMDIVLNSRQEREALELFGCDAADLENLDVDNEYSDTETEMIDHHEIYNPEDIERGYYTERDKIIRKTDLPERFQLKDLTCENLTENDKSLQEEASAVFEELFSDRYFEKVKTCQLLVKLLFMIRCKCYEIPYIHFYERDIITEDEIKFSLEDLWAVFDFHLNWNVVSVKKAKLLNIVCQIEEELIKTNKNKPEQISTIKDSISSIKSTEEIRMIDELLSVSFPHQYQARISNLKNKRHFNKFRRERAAKLDKLCQLFGLESFQYGINIKENYMQYKIQNPHLLPEEEAKNYITTNFPTVELILKRARTILAYQMSREIYIYNYVDSFFRINGKIKIRPTLKGRGLIDNKHDLYKYKYVTDKPLSDFDTNYDYLMINESEKDKDITISLYLTENHKDELLEKLNTLFNNDEFNAVAKAWNQQRSLITSEIVNGFLLPEVIKVSHRRLLKSAQQLLVKEIGNNLYKNINIACYDNQNGNEKTIVVGISYQRTSEFENSAVVAMDNCGTVIETINLKNLLKTGKSKRDKEKRKDDLDCILKMIVFLRPCAVVIDGNNFLSTMLKKDISDFIFDADKEFDIPSLDILVINSQFSMIYSMSSTALKLYSGLSSLQRQAAGVALNLLDPLMAYSQLMNYDKDIKKIKWHLHMSLVSEDLLISEYERHFINVVSKTGVDINRILKNQIMQPMLQFVPGLGPRMAKSLIEKIIQKCSRQYNGRSHIDDTAVLLTNRKELLSERYVGFNVARNCAPFLKVVDISESGEGNILDETRINPMDYDFATNIVRNVLDLEDSQETAQEAIRTVMETPAQYLSDLDFESFAESIYQRNNIKKHLIIQQISTELMNPFQDSRPRFNCLTDQERFYYLTNEDEATLNVGTVAEFRVVNIVNRRNQRDFDNANPKGNRETGLFSCPICHQDNFIQLNEIWVHFENRCPGKVVGVNLVSENQISTFVPIKNISDKFVRNVFDFVQVDKLVVGVVTKIDYSKLKMEASLKPSDVKKAIEKEKDRRDRFYDEEAENEIKTITTKQSQSQAIEPVTVYTRVSFHPNFKNISYEQFIKMSHSLQANDFVIRPSSKGPDCLSISWKLSENLIRHINVIEQEKKNDYTIGKILLIDSEKFEDLDDIIANYLQPMINYVEDIFNYKYYKNIRAEDRQALEKMIVQDKRNNPKRIPYYIVPMYNYPGAFVFVVLPNDKVCYESFLVTPNGYSFRNKYFQNLNQLLENFKSPIQPNSRKRPLTEINQNLSNAKRHR